MERLYFRLPFLPAPGQRVNSITTAGRSLYSEHQKWHSDHDLCLLGHSWAPDYDRSQWLNEKFKLGLDFPNLPYLIDGAHRLTQSNAILRYIARKHNLCGETEEERIRVDLLENQAMDTRLELAWLCYNTDFVSPYWWTGKDIIKEPRMCVPFAVSCLQHLNSLVSLICQAAPSTATEQLSQHDCDSNL
ncbi:glutathione S-transferase Mu 5-like isoform X3 [Erinaceus europaeus]|uniref:glutathione transferase n=1 Tax=Erinaceus europaeus TaxID=9365 RepID=A0ABM3YA23_ERIEU|nr:glutathione S-transferase Mu 5-like isoform X3 [Erinaceus europaeus]XP_060057921.1 glutathione S-transferase Mu 5-like isoform X3 [Erinaceus europaeus]